MKFHDVHGVNAALDETKRVARRINSFCDAFVFSSTPLRLNSCLVIKVRCSGAAAAGQWRGQCFLGLTSKNPISFVETAYTKHIISLVQHHGLLDDVWIKPISAQWADASLTLALNSDGQLEVTTEYDASVKYVFLENLPVNFPLWLVLELYGRNDEVEFPHYSSPNSREILALGSDVFATYKCGEAGIVPYNSARVILIGPKGSGKTQLKKSFISNLNQEPKEPGPSNNYQLCTVNRPGEWTVLASHQIGQNKITVPGIDQSELFREMASNLVHEILLTSRDQVLDSDSPSAKELIKTVLKFPRKLLRPYSKEMKQLSETLSEIPEELLSEVEELLKSIPEQQAEQTEESGPVVDGEPQPQQQQQQQQRYILNICDLNGNLLYLLINQFLFTSCAVYLFVFNLADDIESTTLSKYENLSCISELGNQPITVLRSIHLWISLIHSTIASFPVPKEAGNADADADADAEFELQPQVVLVGTHRNAIHAEPITRNQSVKETFEKIRQSFASTSYAGHLYKQHVALDSVDMSFDEPDLVQSLRLSIESLVRDERMTGFSIPLAWMQLEQILERFRQRGILFVDINQLHEVVSSQIDSFHSYENLGAALSFYHGQGKVFYLDCINQQSLASGNDRQASYELGIIILDPSWFTNCVYDLCSYLCTMKPDDDNLFLGIISENVINAAWSDFIDQKFILLGCLENLDLICELNPYLPLEEAPDVAATAILPKLYFFPWITKPVGMASAGDEPEESGSPSAGRQSATAADRRLATGDQTEHEQQSAGNSDNEENGSQCDPATAAASRMTTSDPGNHFGESTFQFVITFNTLPVSLFTRLLIRLSKWSWNQGWGRKPEMFNLKGRIAVDFDHDIILKISLFQSRIYLIIVKIFEEIPSDQIENLFVGPAANVCVKVQHLVENELAALKNSYYRRLSFQLVIPCPCDAICQRHKIEACIDESCLHFLSLHQCLQKKVVECQYNRQIRTNFIQRFLPFAPSASSGDLHYESMFTPIPAGGNATNNVWESVFQVEQLWMREAAKLLNGTTGTGTGAGTSSPAATAANSDWVLLAKRLSYTERDVIKFSAELSPALALLKDWYESNGRTRYCVDVLVSCLRMLSREDVASLIEYELEPESVSPPIFLSYQHDSQKQVLEIRRRLELSGFPCWMDTRSISGGDSLYGKIYEGISRSKVFICCLTPRYVASPMCNREVALADALHKPILPLIIEFTSWPPPGAMALIMSSIVYVDLCGVGSHSGTGRTQDTESRFREILDHVSRYVSGYTDTPAMVSSSRYLQLPDLFTGGGGAAGSNPAASHSIMMSMMAGGPARSLLMPSSHHHHHHHHHFPYGPPQQLLPGHGAPAGHHHHHHHHAQQRQQTSRRARTSNFMRQTSSDSPQSVSPPMMMMENELDPSSSSSALIMAPGGSPTQQPAHHHHHLPASSRRGGDGPGAATAAGGANAPADLPFSDEIINDDNISVITLTRARIANRITNCSVCIIA